MGINLAKPGINPFIKKPSTSWGEFYFNMAIDMLEATLIHEGTKVVANKLENSLDVNGTSVENIVDNAFFAKCIAEEYDKVIKSGKTIVGNVPFTGGNPILMASTLTLILNKTKLDKNGDLLRDIGPAVQAYWIGATSAKVPTPSIPCIGAAANLTTTIGLNLSPGVWTALPVIPNNQPWAWLLNFIISANLHLLTVGGMFFCNCQYPPPAPPAPGVLPWAGYITKPLSAGPFSGKSWKDILKAAGVTTAEATTAATFAVGVSDKQLTSQNIGQQLTSGLINAKDVPNLSNEQKNAIAALSSGDKTKIADASTALNTNKKV